MGVVKNISISNFPAQGTHLRKRVKVWFHYDVSKFILGTVVRDDMEEPGVEIIRLDDGRHVLSTECQYSIER